MKKQKQQDWGNYFGQEIGRNPKGSGGMIVTGLAGVLKSFVFLCAVLPKFIRRIAMVIRSLLRRKPQQGFVMNPYGQPMPYSQQPMPQQPMPQQPMQQFEPQPMQPASAMQRIPVVPQHVDGQVQLNMLNEVYGAISFIRQSLVEAQRTIGNINAAINDIYQRLNAIEGVQPMPVSRRKFAKNK